MEFLKDLMRADDFGSAVKALAHDFCVQHGLPTIHQLGLVVPDVEAAARELEGQGIGPFFIAEGAPVLWCERGQEREVRLKLGLAYYQGFELEPLEPGEGSEFYGQSLDPEGRTVVQHLGFLVRDVDRWAERLVSAGFPLWVRGRIKAGPLLADFAYMDTVEEAGLIMEFISMRLFGRSIGPMAGLMHGLGRLEKWSGKRSISV